MSVPAYFNGGPIDGEYRVLPSTYVMDYFIPFIEKDSINLLLKGDLEEHAYNLPQYVKYGRYEMNYKSPENGLYTYDWKGTK